jgi:hypothetical protein
MGIDPVYVGLHCSDTDTRGRGHRLEIRGAEHAHAIGALR